MRAIELEPKGRFVCLHIAMTTRVASVAKARLFANMLVGEAAAIAWLVA